VRQRRRSEDVDEDAADHDVGHEEETARGAQEVAEVERRVRVALAAERGDLRAVGEDDRVQRLVRERGRGLAVLRQRGGLLVALALEAEALLRRGDQRRLAAVENLGGEVERRRTAVLLAHLARIINRCIDVAERIRAAIG
jgi:hypothetical protein